MFTKVAGGMLDNRMIDWKAIIPAGFAALGIGTRIYPVENVFTRSLLLFAICGMFVSACVVLWNMKYGRFTLFALVALVTIPLVLPGRDVDIPRLRARYVSALRSYEGTPYVREGEGKLGVDRSGLPRKAYRDALLGEGLRTLNRRLLIECFAIWWSDSTTTGFTEGQQVQLRSLDAPKPLHDSQPKLQPGDLAVQMAPKHVLVYLGNGEWIQADREPAKVLIAGPDNNDGDWRSSIVRTYRWQELADATHR